MYSYVMAYIVLIFMILATLFIHVVIKKGLASFGIIMVFFIMPLLIQTDKMSFELANWIECFPAKILFVENTIMTHSLINIFGFTVLRGFVNHIPIIVLGIFWYYMIKELYNKQII